MLIFQDQMKRWGGVADRAITRFEQMMIARPFVYSPFFGTWSRIIKPVPQGHPLGIILLNLTPGHGRVEQMQLSVTDSLFRREDKFERQVPDSIKELLVSKLGHEKTMFMLECDLWPLINTAKFLEQRKRFGQEPIPLEMCRVPATQGET